MKHSKFIYDENDFQFLKGSRGAGHRLLNALKWVILTVLVSSFFYVLLSLAFWSEGDLRLLRENRSLARRFGEVRSSITTLEDEAVYLGNRDQEIYRAVFNTDAPSMQALPSLEFTVDGKSDAEILSGSRVRLDAAAASAARIESNFRNVCRILGFDGVVLPPMAIPVEDFSVARTGASTGKKMSPFYKVGTDHNGIDIISQAGTAVVASGPGRVAKVIRSGQALGNMVVVDHGNGYVTRYGHLADIRVAEGSRVRRGSVLGYVGLSGKSYAPHLHYEVIRDTIVCNPVNYFFATVTPEEYAGMLILSGETGQSLD